MRHRSRTRRCAALLFLGCAVLAAGRLPDDRGAGRNTRLQGSRETTPPGQAATRAGAFLCAQAAMARGDFDFATSQFLLALGMAPDRRPAAPGRAPALAPASAAIVPQALVASLRAGRPEAAALASLAARIDPENPLAALERASLDAAQGQWAAAVQHYTAMSRRGGFGAMRAVLLGWAQFGAGMKDPWAGRAPRRDTEETTLADGGAIALQQGLMADLANRPADAERLYTAAEADLGPGDFDLARALASLQARQGRRAEAEKTLAGLDATELDLALSAARLRQQIASRPVGDPGDAIAAVYVSFARLARANDAPELADILLRLALALRPHMTVARLWAALWQEADHRPAAALATLLPVEATDALAPSADLRRAALYAERGAPAESLRILASLAAAVPGRAEPWDLEGQVLRGQHRAAASVRAFSAALARLGPSDPATWHVRDSRAAAEAQAGNPGAAEADYLAALKLAPTEPALLLDLGRFWTAQGTSLVRARQMIARAAALEPQDAAAADALGEVALREGDAPAAVRALERAVELRPEDEAINRHLGDAYAAAGHAREAEIQHRRAGALAR